MDNPCCSCRLTRVLQGKLVTDVERGEPGPLWTKLGDVTPAQLAAASKIKKLFTGPF